MARKKATVSSDGPELELEDKELGPKLSAPNLRDLVFLGSVEDTVRIGNFEFKIRTLNGKQQKAALSLTMQKDDDERLAVLRSAILASAIVSVNGAPLESAYEDLNPDGPNLSDLDKKISVVESLQTSVVDRLYLRYDELTKLANDDVEEDALKN
tara:strand:- start:1222 stop:1686 length:465 start_codon:yes stop_codon:yes gene_type:complete